MGCPDETVGLQQKSHQASTLTIVKANLTVKHTLITGRNGDGRTKCLPTHQTILYNTERVRAANKACMSITTPLLLYVTRIKNAIRSRHHARSLTYSYKNEHKFTSSRSLQCQTEKSNSSHLKYQLTEQKPKKIVYKIKRICRMQSFKYTTYDALVCFKKQQG